MESTDWEEEFKHYLGTCSSIKDSTESTFIIHGSQLFDSCPSTVSRLLLNPLDTLESCNGILSEVAQRPSMKLRLSSMPPVLELIRSTVPRSRDSGYFLSFLGTVVKTGGAKVMEWIREYQCKKCGLKESFKAEFEMYQAFNPPKTCLSCNAGPHPWKMSSKLGKPRPEYCKDYQEIKVQEQIQNLGLGTIPRSVWVALEDDLVDSCKPGDDVLVIGTVCRRWKGLGKAPEERTEIELVIRSNFIQVQNDEQAKFSLSHESVEEFQKFWKRHETRPLIGRNFILSSFCPQVYGLFVVKLAVAVILAGGVERIDESGTRVRGEPHMLMVGDPGTGKSQILKYASRLSQRSVMTTGMGSTSAGLTVSAVKAGGVWNLEAGALVLADGGICCIDEFNGIRESDRTCIHEAMEQQSLSIAKAGLVCKLQTRCTVLAAANPKGGYDPEQPLSVNIAVASPLLSRFDLVLILLDLKNEKWDEMVSSYLLNGQKPFDDSNKSNFWTIDTLRSYFSYIKSIKPEMSAEVSQIISRYYQKQRGNEYVNMSRTTVRLLQSIVRLSQGHARLLHHSKVEIVDVVNAILLIEASGGVPTSSQIIVNNSSNTLHSSFPANPLADYYDHAKSVLLGLGLEDLWKEEEDKLRRISEEQGVGDSCELDGSVDLIPPLDGRKDNNNMALTQVMSKLKNKFSFVETVMPRKKGSKKSRGSEKSNYHSNSDSSSDENISSFFSDEKHEKIKTKEKIIDASQNIQLSSDDSDFELLNSKSLTFKKSLNKRKTKKKENNGKLKSISSKISLKKRCESPSNKKAETHLDVSMDIFQEKQLNISRKMNSSHSDLELSLNEDDKSQEEGNKEIKMFNSLRCQSSSSTFQLHDDRKRRQSDLESVTNLEKRSRYSPPNIEHEMHDTSKISDNQSQLTKNESKSSSKSLSLTLNSTVNRFAEFSASTSSPECSQSSTVKTLADIFSQSQDDDLDLEL